MKPILEIKGLSKKFMINHELQPYLSLRDSLSHLFTKKSSREDFWALKEIDLEVTAGETVGIIGRNGAGKSTLLKILSRITPPTEGKIISRGRIASLLEVGTGFHPELSGRENVFMNGSILGMKKAEIAKNFDAIVAFSGVEKFIDTPLKHYSSGMQLRLAFAVAAFLENEVLIVDEVLAVGDAEFQKKCLGKMGEISKSGRTVIFVSHNMGTVSQLCRKTILLKNGRIEMLGDSHKVIQAYNQIGGAETFIGNDTSEKEIFIKKVESFNSNKQSTSTFSHSESIHLRITLGINKFELFQNIGLALLTREKNRVFTVNKTLQDLYHSNDTELTVDFIIDGGLIAPMDYSFIVALNTKSGTLTYEFREDICPIKVYDDGTDLAFAEGSNYGSIIYKGNWNIVQRN